MKKPKKVFLFLAAMILVLGITACDTGSSSDSDDDPEGTPTTPTTPGDSAIPTIDQLVGTWVNRSVETGNYSINTENQTLTITKTGPNTATYFSSELYRRDFTDGSGSDSEYEEKEGVISLSGTGIMTIWLERERESDSPLTDEVPWEEDETESGEAFQIVIINSVLYFAPFERTDTGTGLVGTWERCGEVYYNGFTEFARNTVVITDTTISVDSEESFDGVTYTSEGIQGPASYTATTGTLTTSLFGSEETFNYYLSGNWLVLSDRKTTSTTSFGWVKQ